MLTPEQADGLAVAFERLAQPVTDYLVEDIARRVREAGQLTGAAAYQVWRAQSLGMSRAQVEERVAGLLEQQKEEAARLFRQAAETGYDFDLSHLSAEAVPFAENLSARQITEAAVALAGEKLDNITRTMGFVGPDGVCRALTEAYTNAADHAFALVSAGGTDLDTAVRRTCANLAGRGIRQIDYDSGTSTSLESAIRRDLMGGLGLMAEQISQKNHDDLGADGWEISAHANSAPDHEPFQGRQYADEAYQALNSSLSRRIGTLNCGHNAFPIVLGVSRPQYSQAELERFRRDNEAGVTVDGRHYTGYEATQRQRRLEQAIRAQKRRTLTTQDQDELQAAQIRYQRLNEEYRRFSRAAGLRTQEERLAVSGFGNAQPSRTGAAANRRTELVKSFEEDMAAAGYKTSGFQDYEGDEETLSQMKQAFTRLAGDFPDEARGLTIRLARSEDPENYGWFEDDIRTISFNREMFKSWDELQREYAELVKEGHFPAGTDVRGCFYHEFGHVVGVGRNISGRKCTLDTMVSLGLGFGNPPHMTAKAAKDRLPALLSRYSAEETSRPFDEVIAECFSEWYTSDEPRAFCREFLRRAGVF